MAADELRKAVREASRDGGPRCAPGRKAAEAPRPSEGGALRRLEEELEHVKTGLECLDYVLHQPAGSSTKRFPNSPFPRDCDETGRLRDDRKTAEGTGMRLADFVRLKNAQQAGLNEAMVLALRLYSTAAFRAINNPLRDRSRQGPHRLPATVALLREGLMQLRSLAAPKGEEMNASVDLWRGMSKMDSGSATFMKNGGTELALMSTTTNPAIAVAYAASSQALLFKVKSEDFMNRGIDISWLSAFPEERESLYPPLTYLRPTGRRETVKVGAANFEIVEVIPRV